MTERGARWAGVGIAGTVLGLTALGQVVAFRGGNTDPDPFLLLAMILVGLIGAILVTRMPSNAVSWLLATAGVLGAIAGLVASIPESQTDLTPWQTTAVLIGGPTWVGFIVVVLVLIPLRFPTGRYLSPRWRWPGRASIAAVAAISLVWIFQEQFCLEETKTACLKAMPNPIGIAGVQNPEQSTIGDVLFGVLSVCLIAAMASLVIRYRRARGVERQQLKWLVYAISVFVVEILVVETLWIDVLGNEMPGLFDQVSAVLWLAIPVSIAVAVLRYRLYELDRLISRTVSYAVLAGLLGLVFALGAVWLPALLAGGQSPIFVAVSTLAVAALFDPARRRVQTLVDRRFNRTRYNAERVMESFATSLRDRIDPEGILDGWTAVVVGTMEPHSASVWIRK